MLLTFFLISSSAISVFPLNVGFATPRGRKRDQQKMVGKNRVKVMSSSRIRITRNSSRKSLWTKIGLQDEQTREPIVCSQDQILTVVSCKQNSLVVTGLLIAAGIIGIIAEILTFSQLLYFLVLLWEL